jgi:hypothetical protein
MNLRIITGILSVFFIAPLVADDLKTASPPPSAKPTTYPVVLGACNSGNYFKREPFWTHEAYFQGLRELGVTDLVVHVQPHYYRNDKALGQMLVEMDAVLRRHGITYALNNESSNYNQSVELTPGRNEYEQPGGIHRWDLRMEWLNPLLPPAQPSLAFRGIVYDECDHMLLSSNHFARENLGQKENTFDKPFLVDTTGMDLETAFDQLVKAAAAVRTNHYEGRVELNTEQVWPDLYHVFARAGWSIAPKALKEGITPVVFSVALGAALQYSDRTHFSVSPDIWGLGVYPGHSISAVRSSLMMAYWLGAKRIYIENLDVDNSMRERHPDATMVGSLLNWRDYDHYELTPYGKMLSDFSRKYVPANPRPITWRDYRPRVAIVRLPDGCWGQFPATKKKESPSRDRLLGNRDHPSDAPAREWLQVWSTLTHGVVSPLSLSYWNKKAYPNGIGAFFVPLDSVAVFDHMVTGPVLDSVDCFVVCGHALSAETFSAIHQRAADGATVIIARRLYKAHAPADRKLAGRWFIVDDFSSPSVAAALIPYLGSPTVARYRFAHHMVEFHKTADPDAVDVRITAR